MLRGNGRFRVAEVDVSPRHRLYPERAEELGRKGALAKHAKDRAARGQVDPLGGTILDLAQMLGECQGPTWAAWRAFLKALFALPLEPDALATYRTCTG